MDLLALDSRRGAKTSACVALRPVCRSASGLPLVRSSAPSAASTRVLMYACVHVPYGPLGPLQPALYSPRRTHHNRTFSTSPYKTATFSIDRVTSTYLPYSPGISSFASDRDSLPYCRVIGQSHSTKIFFSPSPSVFAPATVSPCSLIYPGPDISTTDGLPRTRPLLMRFSSVSWGGSVRGGGVFYVCERTHVKFRWKIDI